MRWVYGTGLLPARRDCLPLATRKLYSVFSTVFLMYFSYCLLLVMGLCCLFLILKMFW